MEKKDRKTAESGDCGKEEKANITHPVAHRKYVHPAPARIKRVNDTAERQDA